MNVRHNPQALLRSQVGVFDAFSASVSTFADAFSLVDVIA